MTFGNVHVRSPQRSVLENRMPAEITNIAYQHCLFWINASFRRLHKTIVWNEDYYMYLISLHQCLPFNIKISSDAIPHKMSGFYEQRTLLTCLVMVPPVAFEGNCVSTL